MGESGFAYPASRKVVARAAYVVCRGVVRPDGTDALISHAFEVWVLELYQLFVRVVEW